MKKIISVTTAVLAVVLILVGSVFLSGCQSERGEDVPARNNGAYDGSFGNAGQEFPLNLGDTYKDRNAPQEASVSFMGKTLSGTYERTMSSDLYPHAIHRYMATDKSYFWLDAKTGELRFMMRISNYNHSMPADQFRTEEQCAELAEKTLSEQLGDFSEYTFYGSTVSELGPGRKIFYFEYRRMIDGLVSQDGITIGYHATGELADYDIRTYGMLKGVSLPASYNDADVKAAINAQVKERYAGLGDADPVDYVEKSREVVRMPDGSVALLVSVDVNKLRTRDETGVLYSETVQFVIELG